MMFRLSMIICFTLLQFNLHAQKTNTAVQIGKASFYADRFEGKRTACGERYHHKNYTAAHRSLPFGTLVKVVNLDNKKAVIVRINDRGPFMQRENHRSIQIGSKRDWQYQSGSVFRFGRSLSEGSGYDSNTVYF